MSRKRLVAALAVPQTHDLPFPELTVREREILEQIAAGENNAAIAARFAT